MMRAGASIALLLALASPAAAAEPLTRETKLTHEDPRAFDGFSRSLTMNRDWLAVAAPPLQVYLYQRVGTRWARVDTLTKSTGGSGNYGVDLHFDGRRLIVGAHRDGFGVSNAGAAYIYELTASGFRQEQILFAADGHFGADFGNSVGIDGDRAIVGSPRNHPPGSAYVFRRTAGGTWVQEAKLVPPDGNHADLYGYDVAIVGEFAFVGSPQSDIPSVGAGAVYVYKRSAQSWALHQVIRGDGAGGPRFVGWSVAATPGMFVTSAQPAARVYRLLGDSFELEAELRREGHTGFGIPVATDGRSIVVGDVFDDTVARDAGSSVLFRHDGTTWTQVQTLTASNARAADNFGYTAAVVGDVVAVGTPFHDTGFVDRSGSAWVFDRSQTMNRPPVADAGEDALVECDAPGVATVVLDGSSSNDPDDDLVGFEWTEDWNNPWQVPLGTTAIAREELAIGTHDVTLWVTDGFGHARRDDVVKMVADTTPPVGRIVSPERDSCHGSDSIPVVVVDDLSDPCDPAFRRFYEPTFRPETKIGRPHSGRFGAAVAVDGETVVATDFDLPFEDHGAAYVFGLDGEEWIEHAELVNDDAIPGDRFGTSVAILSDVIVVGAIEAGAPTRAGAAYVYRRFADGWAHESTLTPTPGASRVRFGRSVAIGRDVIVVGATAERDLVSGGGAVYVFVPAEDGWVLEQKLVVSDPQFNHSVGIGVAISGDTIIAGAGGDDDVARDAGAAYVFRKVGGIWVEETKLTAEDGLESDLLGSAVALRGDLATVSSFSSDGASENTGAVYVFRRHGTEWSLEAKLFAGDGRWGDAFGRAAIGRDTIVVGALSNSNTNGNDAGAVYIFERTDHGWAEVEKLLPLRGNQRASYGNAIALQGARMVVGAIGERAVFIHELNEGYSTHGDHVVDLKARDVYFNSATYTTRFTIDLEPPGVVAHALARRDVTPSSVVSVADVFETHDDDGALGAVVSERLLLDECPVLDGRAYGDGDGLLTDEQLRFDRAILCRAFELCGTTVLDHPSLTLEATDCGGNTAAGSTTLRLRKNLYPGICVGSSGPPGNRRRAPRSR